MKNLISIGKYKTLLYPILIALLAFELVVGYERIMPTNIAWLTRTGWTDGWGAYLGWETYRYSPWTFSIGSNLAYGMNIGNSLVYSDSIPLFAIPLKLISPFLPVPFQYFGFWTLICFCLQAIFTWKIFSRYTNSKTLLSCATVIFLFSPILFKRVNVHMSQIGHFLFLWALYLILQRQVNKARNWLVLISISALVHPYFLVINSLIFIANEFYLQNVFRFSYLKIVQNTLVVFISSFPILWLAGYFVSIGGATNPFSNDLFKMDLAQPINFTGWTILFSKRFPNQQGNLEGFNYLGPGTLFLTLFSLSAILIRWLIKGRPVTFKRQFLRYLPFFLVSAFFTLYAVTYKVTFARYELFTVPLPDEIKTGLTSFRASGRFFAPVFYFFTFLILKVCIGFSKRRLAGSLLLFATILQVVDTRPGWQPIKSINQPSNSLALGDIDFQKWSHVLSDRKTILTIPSQTPTELCPEWRLVGYLAYQFRLDTNCFYFARTSAHRKLVNRQSTIKLLEEGDPTHKVVLVLGEKEYAKNFQPKFSDNWKLTRISGLFVLSPVKE